MRTAHGSTIAFFTLLFTGTSLRSQCPDPFFSEIVEGTGSTKAIEVFNPGMVALDMAHYVIRCFPNGAAITTGFVQLSGTLAPASAMVVTNAQLAAAGVEMDGDDALTLEWIGSVPPYDLIVDVFGEPGVDPGAGWTDDMSADFTDANGAVPWTMDHTLARKISVTQGVHTCCPSPFNVTLEWDSLPVNIIAGLGSHTAPCLGSGISEGGSLAVVRVECVSDQLIGIRAERPIQHVRLLDPSGRVLGWSSLSPAEHVVVNAGRSTGGLVLVEIRFADGGREVARVVKPY